MDQTRDLSGQQQNRLTQLFSTPDFVKAADAAAICGEPDMDRDLFADPVHGLYPCHTPAATWTSTAFFLTKRAEFRPGDAEAIDQRLHAYAKYHCIGHLINTLRKEAATPPPDLEAGLNDDDYALVLNETSGTRRHYPLRNSLEVKKAAEYLQQNRDFLPYNLRREFADKVLQKAAAFGADLGVSKDLVDRTAGYGACATKTAVAMLRDRVKAASHGPGGLSPIQTELLGLASKFELYPSKLRDPGIRVKLAAVVDDFDRAHGLTSQYGTQLLRPEDVIFEFTQEKAASVAADHVANPATGAIYKLADLERVRTENVRQHMGDDLANAIGGLRGYLDSEKAAEVIPTLDRGFAERFDRLLSAHGIMPVAKEASAETLGHSNAYLRELAEGFRQTKTANS